MDARHFDALARSLTKLRDRRGLLELLAALPLVGGLFALLDDEAHARGRRKRRKKRHKHGRPRRHGRRKCKRKSRARICAGKCGTVKNNCGKKINCGPCLCDPACPICQTCDTVTQTCVPDPAQNDDPCDDGDLCTINDTCQNGICQGNPVTCDDAPVCRVGPGTCNPDDGACLYPLAPQDTDCSSAVPCGRCDGSGVCVGCTGTDCCGTDGLCHGDQQPCRPGQATGICCGGECTCFFGGNCRVSPGGAICCCTDPDQICDDVSGGTCQFPP